MTLLTKQFSDAVDYVRIAHAAQTRKGSNIPYIYHLLAVSSLVIENGGSEDQAIAALLHDVIEDCGEVHRTVVRARFGDAVANIVEDCTDATAESKASHASPEARKHDWTQRKLTYLAHLAGAPDATLLVSGCDKLHNAQAIVADLENPVVGTKVFDRFTGGRDGTLRYYHSIVAILVKRKVRVAPRLDAVVARMHALAGVSAREMLVAQE